jgi:hypothetical protein
MSSLQGIEIYISFFFASTDGHMDCEILSWKRDRQVSVLLSVVTPVIYAHIAKPADVINRSFGGCLFTPNYFCLTTTVYEMLEQPVARKFSLKTC